jgi:MFS family permease
MLVSTYVNS